MTNEVEEAATSAKRSINALFRDNHISPVAALIAMADIMMDIALDCAGMSEQDARKLLAALFLIDDMKN
jgi:hypothetical protein